jgi:hypothetical protein
VLKADRRVVSDLHLQIMRVVARTEEAYGEVGLRLEGGTALAAYHLKHRARISTSSATPTWMPATSGLRCVNR